MAAVMSARLSLYKLWEKISMFHMKKHIVPDKSGYPCIIFHISP